MWYSKQPTWKGDCIPRLFALVCLGLIVGAEIEFDSRAQAETKITPSVGLSQRYDSNVFYGPKEFIPTGRQEWDLVTTVDQQVQILNKSRLGDTAIGAGVSGNVFAYNTDLSFVSTNVNASSDLSGWTNELLPGLKFRVSEAFLYSPEPPAFMTGGKPGQTADVFSRGIQSVRANTFKNVLYAGSDYLFSRSASFRTDYTYSLIRQGSIRALEAAPIVFFDTTTHNIAAGPTFRFGGRDTLFMRYSYATTETSSIITTVRFVTHTVQPEYESRIVSGYKLTISGGATLIEQAGNRTFFSGRLALWTEVERGTTVTMSLSRQAAPLFIGVGGVNGGAIISSVAQLSVSHGFSKVLRLTVDGNYAYNESTPVSTFKFTSQTASARLEYKLTRSTVLSLQQEYNKFFYSTIPTFDRYATWLMLRTEWK